MKNYFKEKGIEKLRAYSTVTKAAIAERGRRTLKQKIYRYFSRRHTLRWLDILSPIIAGINKSKSRVIGMRPIDVTPENSQEIWERVYAPYLRSMGRKPKYKVGETMRMAKDKGVFEKGFLPNYSDEIVKIKGIKKGHATLYTLEDDKGKKFLTRFYEQELSKTRKDAETTYRIDEILDTRIKRGKTEHLVKFIGYPDPEWIKESDMET